MARSDNAPHKNQTSRPTVAAMEKLIGRPFPVLDHGFIRVVDYMGDDAAIVQAARVSYGRGTKTRNDDAALIRYLLRHKHMTPFEMCELKIHVKLPIFVARQWIRHRTASVNEYSARYSILDSEFYVPPLDGITAQSSSNKQGRGAQISKDKTISMQKSIRHSSITAFDLYNSLLDGESDEFGISREIARIVLPLSAYTQWYWKVNLRNLLHFIGLRADAHAQLEIRLYAEKLLEIVRRWVPVTSDAYKESELNALTLTSREIAVLSQMLRGEPVTQESAGLGARDWEALMQAFGISDIQKR